MNNIIVPISGENDYGPEHQTLMWGRHSLCKTLNKSVRPEHTTSNISESVLEVANTISAHVKSLPKAGLKVISVYVRILHLL